MTKTTPLHGLTPAQIRKAISGTSEKAPEPVDIISPPKKRPKPERSHRKIQSHDFGVLLDLPYSTTMTAIQYPTPPWFTSTQKPEVSIVVPVYRQSAEVLIESLDLSVEGMRVEVVFVDDNCPVDSKQLVLKEWEKKKDKLKGPVGRIYHSTATQGWTACCNIGAEKAMGDIVVFLHPDVKVGPGWLRPMVRLLRKAEIGVVGGMQIDGDTMLDAGSQWVWDKEDFGGVGRSVYNGKPISRPFKLDNCPEDLFQMQEREAVSSYCMAVRRADFLDLGGFSPNVSNAKWADADFCAFVREKGLKVVCQPGSPVERKPDDKPDRYESHGKHYFVNRWITSGRYDRLAFVNRPTPAPEIELLLVRRRAAHGDVLMAASVLPALKKKYPKAKVVFSTDCPEILQNNPHVDKIVEEHSERHFQLYINLDMVYEYRPNVNMLTAYAEAAGVSPRDCVPFLDCEPLDVELPEKYVVVHAGKTLWAGRNWSTIKFDGLAKKLKESGHSVVVVGTGGDHKTTVCDVDLRGKTTVHQLATAIKGAGYFVGIDSFPMHIAQTFNVPGAAFFGSIKPNTRLYRPNMKPVYAEGLKCLGCHHRRPTPCTSTNVCEVGVQDCINNVTVDMFWRTVELSFEKVRSR